ncbi:hypothetical protein [Chryseobacterium terrae]|uniref:Uncharacterized protein n=1 Tax=Chryseobacterium terrae TaxID=3163299 RepID=A0ABW8Y0L1_9FLAO
MKINDTVKTIIGVASIGIFFVWILSDIITIKSKFDKIEQPNDKLVSIFNDEVDHQIKTLAKDIAKPMIPEGEAHLKDYLKNIKTIETYAKHGVTSTQNRNYLRVKFTFNNNQTIEKNTDRSCSGNSSEPCLLIKVDMQDGKAVKILTNGQEQKNSEHEAQQYIAEVLEKIFIEDLINNNERYYPPIKTEKNFENEWNNTK